MSELARPALTPRTFFTTELQLVRAPVFTPGWDLLLFAAPVVFVLLVLGHDLVFGYTDYSHLLYPALFVLMVSIDKAHIWSTVFRSYLDAETRRAHPFLLYGLPPLVVLAGLALELSAGWKTLYRLFLYYQMYHVIRQQYGWLRLAASRARPDGSRISLRCDEYLLYAMVILPFAWQHVAPGDYLGGLQLATPIPTLATLLAGLLVGCVAGYAGLQLVRMLVLGERVSTAELLIAGTTALVWSGQLLLKSRHWLFLGFTYHAIPYIAAALWTAKARNQERALWRHRWAVPCFLAALLPYGYLWQRIQDGVMRTTVHPGLSLSLTALALVVPTMHYAIDGVIWRRGGGLGALFRSAHPPRASR